LCWFEFKFFNSFIVEFASKEEADMLIYDDTIPGKRESKIRVHQGWCRDIVLFDIFRTHIGDTKICSPVGVVIGV